MKFVFITPVRNEEQYILITIKCMLEQTLKPVEWIIVNDGSTDNTKKIIKRYSQKYPFIRLVSLKNRGYRKPGTGVIEAFYEGLKQIKNKNFDIIAKFDGDLKFKSDMLQKISNAFIKDDMLGITGGVRYERKNINSHFEKVLVPKGFVGGPYKFYRKKCFEDICGLISRAGWDGVDTIKAQMKGWKTGEIETIKIIHLKPTGSAKGEGLRKANMKYGDVSYYMGGFFWYFLFRIAARSFENKNAKIGYYMLKGYYESKRNHLSRENIQFRKFLKRAQVKNCLFWIKLLPKEVLKK